MNDDIVDFQASKEGLNKSLARDAVTAIVRVLTDSEASVSCNRATATDRAVFRPSFKSQWRAADAMPL